MPRYLPVKIACAWLLIAGALAADESGYLSIPSSSRARFVSYEPREGDLIFFRYPGVIRQSLYLATTAGRVTHVGLVVRDARGDLALLETGEPGVLRRLSDPFDPLLSDNSLFAPAQSQEVTITPVSSVLYGYGEVLGRRLVGLNRAIGVLDREVSTDHPDTRIWVRRFRDELSARESSTLTNFALEQEGKPYANLRMLGVVPRIPLHLLARDRNPAERDDWFCSELVATALVHAGLMSGRVNPAGTDPQDLFNDWVIDISDLWEPARTWVPDPSRRRLLPAFPEIAGEPRSGSPASRAAVRSPAPSRAAKSAARPAQPSRRASAEVAPHLRSRTLARD